jgi:effector-binding domain-containing protein
METKKVSNRKYFSLSATTTLNQLPQLAGREVELLYAEAQKNNLSITGPVEFIYFDCSAQKDQPFEFVIALPVTQEYLPENGKYSIRELAEFNCFSHIHYGDVSDLHPVYGKLYEEIGRGGLMPSNQIREIYEKFVSLESPENITEIQIGIQ